MVSWRVTPPVGLDIERSNSSVGCVAASVEAAFLVQDVQTIVDRADPPLARAGMFIRGKYTVRFGGLRDKKDLPYK